MANNGQPMPASRSRGGATAVPPALTFDETAGADRHIMRGNKTAPTGQGRMKMSTIHEGCVRAIRRGLTALLLAACGLSAVPARAAPPACQIVIGSCHRPPLSDATGTGIIDHLVIEAFRRAGLAACIEPLACERSLRNADSGVTDGDLLRVPAAVAHSSPNLVAVPEVLYTLPMNGFAVRHDLKVGGMDSLSSLRVGHILGWKILEEQVRAATTLRVRGPEELFTLLTAGKADLVIYERVTGLHLVREMGLAGIRALKPPLLVTPQYLMLNHRHRHLVEPLAAALRALKADGGYAAAFKSAGYPAPEAP